MSFFRFRWIATAMIALTCTSVLGQGYQVTRGDRYFEKFDFVKASKIYKKALGKSPENEELKTKVANCYRLMNDMEQAELYYSLVVLDESHLPIHSFYYAQALQSNEKYDESKPFFEGYTAEVPADQRGANIARGIDLIDLMKKENPLFQVEPLGINTGYSEFSPAFYRGGIIFASDRAESNFFKRLDLRTQSNFLNLFRASKDDGGVYQEVAPFSDKRPNGKFHEGPVSLNDNETILYLTRSNYVVGNEERSKDKIVHLKLFRMTYKNGAWGDIQEAVAFNSNEYSVGHPALAVDESALFFMSNMPGGYGGTDLYVTYRKGDGWGEPVNLGDRVNTAGNEMFPFASAEGKLYFASDGHIGLGGLDIYRAEETNGAWGRIANMGAPLNSNRDDFGYIFDEDIKEGYLTSNRDGGFGSDDIYHFVKQGVLISGTVIDAKSGEPVPGATVKMEDGKQAISDARGGFRFTLNPNQKIELLADKSEYLPGNLEVDVSNTPMVVKIPLQRDEGIVAKVTIQDKKTREKLSGANVTLINMTTGKETDCVTQIDGSCVYNLEPETRYRIEGGKQLGDPNKRYLTVTTEISTVGKTSGAELYSLLELELLEIGVAIKIENIYYDLNKWFIRPDAAIELDKIVKLLRDNPTMEIELSSHTDSRGSDSYNRDLSRKRALSAVEYITSKNVTGPRLVAAGYGEDRLTNRCRNGVSCSDGEHQANRRTEFKILKF